MKIFVGVLHTYENEYDESLESIGNQIDCEFQLFEFHNLKNKQAHDALYSTFMNRRDEFDIMIKVDADMVLTRNTFFKEIVDVFNNDKEVDRLYVAVHDFFTDRLIMGLNSFRNTVRWEKNNKEDLFVDTRPIANGVKVKDYKSLAPGALHCPNPSPFQAFHFGVHKAVKAIQPEREFINMAGGKRHWSNIMELKKAYASKGNILRGYALLGAEFGLGGNVLPSHLDFDNEELRSQFDNFMVSNEDQLQKTIRIYSRRNFWWLPTVLQERILRKFKRK